MAHLWSVASRLWHPESIVWFFHPDIQEQGGFWILVLAAHLVTLLWHCVLGIFSESRLSVHWILQAPQAACCCGTQHPLNDHLPRTLVQDGPFHSLPSPAWCSREPSSHQPRCHLGFQISASTHLYEAWRTEKCVALLGEQCAHRCQKECTSPQNTTLLQGNCCPGV